MTHLSDSSEIRKWADARGWPGSSKIDYSVDARTLVVFSVACPSCGVSPGNECLRIAGSRRHTHGQMLHEERWLNVHPMNRPGGEWKYADAATEFNQKDAMQLGAWKLAARQCGAINEVAACRDTTPEDIIRLVASLRATIERERKEAKRLTTGMSFCVTHDEEFSPAAGEICGGCHREWFERQTSSLEALKAALIDGTARRDWHLVSDMANDLRVLEASRR